MKKRRQRTTPLAAAIFAAMLSVSCLIGGCAAGSKAASSADYAPAETAAAMEVTEMQAGEMGMPERDAVNFAAGARPESAAPEEGAAGKTADASDQAKAAIERKLIRNVDMSVETDTFDSLISGITGRITELGGYVEQSDISGQQTNYRNEPIPRNAYLTARIPCTKLDLFINAVEEGGNVLNKNESTQDVTLRYSDTLSRKKSLTIEQERIWALLEKADTIESIIALEERLSDIRYELESLESQLRLYDNQVDYSTVTLNIHEVRVYTPTAPETVGQRISSGFSRSLKNMTDFCVNFVVCVAASSPVWVPILVLLAAALLIYRRRKWKKNFVKGTAKSFEITPDSIEERSDSNQ